MAGGDPITFRPARESDLDACTRIWKAGIDDYQGRLNQGPMPDDLGPLRRVFGHILATDPERFWVACPGDADTAPVGFSAALVRGDLWFLAMLFVLPDWQGRELGSALMDRALAGRTVVAGEPVPGPDGTTLTGPDGTPVTRWGMCTDALQPISNALYARRGMVPRIPAWRMYGEIVRPRALGVLPGTLEVVTFEAIADGGPTGHRRLADLVNALDRDLLGFEHGADHAFLRRDGRIGVLVRDRATGRPVGYGYGSGSGRMGPFAALDPELVAPIIGATAEALQLPGPVAAWIPGSLGHATQALLAAGLRFDGYPALVCWAEGPHPFERYAPISLAIV